MANVPKQCESIALQLQSAKELADDLFNVWQTATGQDKSRAFFLWRSANSKVRQLAVALNKCVNPPPLLPDLVPVNVRPTVHQGGQLFDAAVVINNEGAGRAAGPFKVTLGVEYVSYSQDPPLRVFRELTLNVPAGVTIEPGATYTTSDSMKNIQINRRPGSTMPPLFDFYILVDPDNQIAEKIEGNNYLQLLSQRLPGV